jgi:NDP-sugar pyrophosphorylase family protein
MKVMLLAAGRGERLRPLTDTTPKCMLQFEGKPLLEHWIHKLHSVGIRDVVINVHHLAEVVVDHFGSGERWDMHIEYSRESELLGTSGALRQVKTAFEGGSFLVIYADNQSTCGLRNIIEFHSERRSVATMSVCWIEDPRSCGIVGFDDQCRIQRFLEKPTAEQVFSHYINAGIYVFEPEVFDYIPANRVSDFSREVFPLMLTARAPLYAFPYEGYVLKFDSFEDWTKSEAIAAEEKKKFGSCSCFSIRPVEKLVQNNVSATWPG